jgi:type VI secretion system protein ImpF
MLLDRMQGSLRKDHSTWQQVLPAHVESLLNDAVRSATLPLEGLPFAQRSVINHGLPPFARVDSGIVDARGWAAHIQEILRAYEPRLEPASIRVTPVVQAAGQTMIALVYRIIGLLRGEDGLSMVSFCIALDYSCRSVRIVPEP